MTPHLAAARAMTRSLAADGVQIPARVIANATNAALAAAYEVERQQDATYDAEHGLGSDAA